MDRATSYLPDILFAQELEEFKDRFQVNFATLARDHPLKECDRPQLMHFVPSGAPKKELRVCRAALLYCSEFPSSMGWGDAEAARYKRWRKSKVEVAKLGYLTWRALHESANDTLAVLSAEPGAACQLSQHRGEVAREATRAARAAVQRCVKTSERRRQEEFEKWAAVDPTADTDITLPGALKPVDAQSAHRDDSGTDDDT